MWYISSEKIHPNEVGIECEKNIHEKRITAYNGSMRLHIFLSLFLSSFRVFCVCVFDLPLFNLVSWNYKMLQFHSFLFRSVLFVTYFKCWRCVFKTLHCVSVVYLLYRLYWWWWWSWQMRCVHALLYPCFIYMQNIHAHSPTHTSIIIIKEQLNAFEWVFHHSRTHSTTLLVEPQYDDNVMLQSVHSKWYMSFVRYTLTLYNTW